MYQKQILLLTLFIITLFYQENVFGFALKSPAFQNGTHIPPQYTCNGDNIPPPLTWQDPPIGTQSFVLILDDPDAPSGVWDHWLVFNIPAATHILPADVAQTGVNSWRHIAYDGPCPPENSEHRYSFRLYALDTFLPLNTGATKTQILNAMRGHVIDEAELMGKYVKEKDHGP